MISHTWTSLSEILFKYVWLCRHQLGHLGAHVLVLTADSRNLWCSWILLVFNPLHCKRSRDHWPKIPNVLAASYLSYLSTLEIPGSWGIAWQGCCRRYWRWGMWLESEWRPLTFFKVTREIPWQLSRIIHKTPSASQALVSRAADELPAVFQDRVSLGLPGVIRHRHFFTVDLSWSPCWWCCANLILMGK